MKFALSVLLVIGTAVASDFECRVKCPGGYRGVCVKSSSACNCSCEKESRKAADYVVGVLQEQEAPQSLQQNARQLLENRNEVPPTTLTDRRTGNQFTIFMNPQK
jgi:hypothetical protein